jgi:hypothetical protein
MVGGVLVAGLEGLTWRPVRVEARRSTEDALPSAERLKGPAMGAGGAVDVRTLTEH